MSDLAHDDFDKTSIAIVGLAGRFPGAANVADFWSNLKNSVESVSEINDDDLRKVGIPEDVLRDPSYVKAGASIPDIELFDAEFFRYSAREAELIDPQHRIFLECAAEALENANCDPQRFDGAIGVFAGSGLNAYLLLVLNEQQAAAGSLKEAVAVNRALAIQGNDKDYLATRVSYKLGLRGPSLSVQTACSTSLVTVHLACQSLMSGECDLALAGGISVHGSLKKGGYHFVEGGILAPDGHCRPFDARGNGTVFGEGVGIVALKRLQDALAGGDHIHAVIRGSAVNNDGSMKVGYTAPSVDGQAAVIAEALAVGGIAPETVGYVEAHGTGTRLGDPMEVEALHQVFRTPARRHCCALGSVKSNIGHLNTAAGVTGLIKAVLCVEHGEIPASLNFSEPNPAIDFANSPFYVPNALSQWPETKWPRRAGVSSFGIGGTNAHVVVEQAPKQKFEPSKRSFHLALITAKQATAMEQTCARLHDHVDGGSADIADICHTLSAGRSLHQCARFAIVRDSRDLANVLATGESSRLATAVRAESVQSVTFLFPGQGSQQMQMGRHLYAEEPVFREQIDHCAAALQPHLQLDLRALLFSDRDGDAAALLRNTVYAQPAIFAVSYALAQLWMSLGVSPKAALGHSIGEFVAACLAEVFSLEDGLRITALRGQLMQHLPTGSMLAVAISAHEMAPLLTEQCSIAADNGAEACVASGPADQIAELQRLCAERDIAATLLHTSHAFHSPMMQPAVAPFIDFMAGVDLKPPQSPYISNLTGDWISDSQATDPAYWGRHLTETVQFHKGLRTVLRRGPAVLLEVGPGTALARLARAVVDDSSTVPIISSLPHASSGTDEVATWLRAAAELWYAGVPIDWAKRYQGERRRKLQLPNYPFERQRYWIASERPSAAREPDRPPPVISDGTLHTLTWKRADHLGSAGARVDESARWLVFTSGRPVEQALIELLQDRGQTTVAVDKVANGRFKRFGDCRFALNPDRESDFRRVLAALGAEWLRHGQLKVVYFCNARDSGAAASVRNRYHDQIADKINAPILLLRSLAAYGTMNAISVTIVTRGLRDVIGGEQTDPMAALALGPCLAAKFEYPGLETRIVDVSDNAAEAEGLADILADDLASPPAEVVTAYRRNKRWLPMLEPIPSRMLSRGAITFRTGGVYLITGGLGGIGLAIAERLARDYQAKLVLIGRTSIPDRAAWDRVLSDSTDDRLAGIIRSLMRIEACGGEVMVGRADAADLQQMRKVAQQTDAKFGTIHGVLHAAGVPGSTPIGIKTLKQLDEVLRPKILGLASLDQLFAKRDLDFLVSFSSTSALQGRAGQVDYIGANAYLDSYALRTRRTAKWPTITINWDAWSEVGMAVNGAQRRDGAARSLINGLSTAEGVQAFFDSLATGIPQVIVSKLGVAGNRNPAEPQADDRPMRVEPPESRSRMHPRPALPTPYVAPETELENAISAIWIDVLKTRPIGLDDNFFDLGGHSLLALQLLPRIRDRFQIVLEPRELFTEPTVAGVVAMVENKMLAELEEAN